MFTPHPAGGFRTVAPGIEVGTLCHGDATLMVEFRMAAGLSWGPPPVVIRARAADCSRGGRSRGVLPVYRASGRQPSTSRARRLETPPPSSTML